MVVDDEDSVVARATDPVQRLATLLLKVAETDIPELQLHDQYSFVFNVFQLDHPFGQAWRELHGVATEEFDEVRVGRDCIDADQPNDLVHFRANHPPGSKREVTCGIALYADGSTRIRSHYDAGLSNSLRTFVAVERGEPLTRGLVLSATKAVVDNQA